MHSQSVSITVSPTCTTILYLVQNLHRLNMRVCTKQHHHADHHQHAGFSYQFLQISQIRSNSRLPRETPAYSIIFGHSYFSLSFPNISYNSLNFYSPSETWSLLFTGAPIKVSEFCFPPSHLAVPVPDVAWERNSGRSSVAFKLPTEPGCGPDGTHFVCWLVL